MVVNFMRVNNVWRSAMMVLVAVAGLGLGSAQAADLKIGVVNVNRLGQQAPQTKAMGEQLQTEFASRQRELAALQKDLQSKDETLRRDGAVMSEEERRNMERQLRDGQRDLQRKGQELQEDMNIRNNEEMAKLQRILFKEIFEFSQSNGYDLVVTEVIYANPALDITDQVLASLEAKFKKGE